MIEGCFFTFAIGDLRVSNQPDQGYIALGQISTKEDFIMMKIAPLERCKSVKIAIATYEITVIFCMYIF